MPKLPDELIDQIVKASRVYCDERVAALERKINAILGTDRTDGTATYWIADCQVAQPVYEQFGLLKAQNALLSKRVLELETTVRVLRDGK